MRLMIEQTVSETPSNDVPSPRVLELAAMFGLGLDEEQSICIVPRCEIPVPAGGGIVFITGPSGSGKSTILHLIAAQCMKRGLDVLRLDELPPPTEAPLVDVLGGSLEQAVSLLSSAGLGDAFVMLRKPSQLSDGQRARLQLAQAMEWAEQSLRAADDLKMNQGTDAAEASGLPKPDQWEECSQPTDVDGGKCRVLAKTRHLDGDVIGVAECSSAPEQSKDDSGDRAVGTCSRRLIIADEFAATLDRLTAKTLARSIRRWIERTQHVFIAATTHDDLLEALEPDVLVYKGLGDPVEVCVR